MNDQPPLVEGMTIEGFARWLTSRMQSEPRLRTRLRGRALDEALQQSEYQERRSNHDLLRRNRNHSRRDAQPPLPDREWEPEPEVSLFSEAPPAKPHLVMAALLESLAEEREPGTRQTGEVIPTLIGKEDEELNAIVLSAVFGLGSLNIEDLDYLRTVVEEDAAAVGGAAPCTTSSNGSLQSETLRKKLPLNVAQRRAREILDTDPTFRNATVREWARRIGCSTGSVGNLPARKAVRENRPAATPRPKAGALTGKRMEDATAPDIELYRLVQDQVNDFELSPLSPDDPRRPTRIRAYKQV